MKWIFNIYHHFHPFTYLLTYVLYRRRFINRGVGQYYIGYVLKSHFCPHPTPHFQWRNKNSGKVTISKPGLLLSVTDVSTVSCLALRGRRLIKELCPRPQLAACRHHNQFAWRCSSSSLASRAPALCDVCLCVNVAPTFQQLHATVNFHKVDKKR